MIEYDANGKVIKEVPSQIDMISNTNGEVIWIMDGNTPANSVKHYCIYFDLKENRIKNAPNYNTDLSISGKVIQNDQIYVELGDTYGTLDVVKYKKGQNLDISYGSGSYLPIYAFNDLKSGKAGNRYYPTVTKAYTHQGPVRISINYTSSDTEKIYKFFANNSRIDCIAKAPNKYYGYFVFNQPVAGEKLAFIKSGESNPTIYTFVGGGGRKYG